MPRGLSFSGRNVHTSIYTKHTPRCAWLNAYRSRTDVPGSFFVFMLYKNMSVKQMFGDFVLLHFIVPNKKLIDFFIPVTDGILFSFICFLLSHRCSFAADVFLFFIFLSFLSFQTKIATVNTPLYILSPTRTRVDPCQGTLSCWGLCKRWWPGGVYKLLKINFTKFWFKHMHLWPIWFLPSKVWTWFCLRSKDPSSEEQARL